MPYGNIIEGRVTGGNRLGRELGFPTANIPVGELKVADGVYVVRVHVGEQCLEGIANIGRKPSVGKGNERMCEIHLFGFDGDLYGKCLRAQLISYIRPEHQFPDLDALRRQIRLDVQKARAILENEEP